MTTLLWDQIEHLTTLCSDDITVPGQVVVTWGTIGWHALIVPQRPLLYYCNVMNDVHRWAKNDRIPASKFTSDVFVLYRYVMALSITHGAICSVLALYSQCYEFESRLEL